MGLTGAPFVVTQYHTSVMFSRSMPRAEPLAANFMSAD
jgi:hypothetical protein